MSRFYYPNAVNKSHILIIVLGLPSCMYWFYRLQFRSSYASNLQTELCSVSQYCVRYTLVWAMLVNSHLMQTPIHIYWKQALCYMSITGEALSTQSPFCCVKSAIFLTSAAYSWPFIVCSDPLSLVEPQWRWNCSKWNLSLSGPPVTSDKKKSNYL